MPQAPSLFEEYEHRGEFWLPSRRRKRIAGVLTIKQGEPRLLLMGMLPGAESIVVSKVPVVPAVVHGETTTGMPITLQQLRPIRQSFGFGPSHGEYVADLAAIGDRFAEGTRFRSFGVSFTGLDDWAAHTPFDERWTRPKSGKPGAQRLRVSFRRPRAVRVTVPARDATISLDFGMSSNGSDYSRTWAYETFLRIDATKPQPLDWFFRIRDELRNAMALLVGDAVFTRSLRTDDDPRQPVAIFHTQRGAVAPTGGGPDALFALPALRRIGFARLLRRWFAVMSRFKPTIDLYLGTVYPPSTFVEFEFIALTQALESFHRRRYPGHYVSEKEYGRIADPMRQAIPASTPAPLRDKLLAILKWGNEYSMRKRLGEIFRGLGDTAWALVSARKRSDFIGTLVDARNYWTHHPVDAEGAPLKGRPLYLMPRRLRVLLHLLLLKEIGIGEQAIVQRIREHPRLRSYAEAV